MSPFLGLLLYSLSLIIPVECFIATPRHHRNHNKWSTDTSLFSSNDGKGRDELGSMRLLLEQSWNAETMGEIPADASVAAKEAFQTIESASANGVSVFLVDLLLPSYDINQGSNLYDEVLAVEYCIALSEYLEGKSSILVRDAKVLQTVSRILDARETAMEGETLETETESDDDDETLEVVEKNEDVEDEEEEVDDEEEEEDVSLPASEIDTFRQSLKASWNVDEVEDGPVVEPPTASAPETTRKEKIAPSKPKKKIRRHRLASMFGNNEISQGADMMTEVVNAIRENALPEEDEENMIILSSLSLEETVAVRSLVGKYGDRKKVILVNCKLDPLPPELRTAETVYSLLPLITKPKASIEEEAPPKVVVLRRYPKPWEIYVDVGAGFQLADSIPAGIGNKRGIRMDQITESVKRFLR
jgi:hypothetical protein